MLEIDKFTKIAIKFNCKKLFSINLFNVIC